MGSKNEGHGWWISAQITFEEPFHHRANRLMNQWRHMELSWPFLRQPINLSGNAAELRRLLRLEAGVSLLQVLEGGRRRQFSERTEGTRGLQLGGRTESWAAAGRFWSLRQLRRRLVGCDTYRRRRWRLPRLICWNNRKRRSVTALEVEIMGHYFKRC